MTRVSTARARGGRRITLTAEERRLRRAAVRDARSASLSSSSSLPPPAIPRQPPEHWPHALFWCRARAFGYLDLADYPYLGWLPVVGVGAGETVVRLEGRTKDNAEDFGCAKLHAAGFHLAHLGPGVLVSLVKLDMVYLSVPWVHAGCTRDTPPWPHGYDVAPDVVSAWVDPSDLVAASPSASKMLSDAVRVYPPRVRLRRGEL